MTSKERKDMKDEFKWDLSLMFKTKEDFEKELASVKPMLPALNEFRGKLGDESGESLAKFLELSYAMERKLDRLGTYAGHLYDQDMRDAEARSMKDRVTSVAVEMSSETSWMAPEVMAIPDAALEKIRAAECMRPYVRALEMLLHVKPHTLSESEEKIMSLADDALLCAYKSFGSLSNADMKFPMVKGADGKEEVELTHGNFIQLMRSFDRGVRRGAFEAMYDTYEKVKNTMTSLIDGQVRSQVFNARARHYGSALEASLFADCVPVDVYNSLIDAVHESFPAYYKYVALRKRCLGLEGALDMYDQYVPIVADFNPTVPYEQAQEWVREAVKPLGAAYCKMIEEALTSKWIDVYENRGKRSGAYSGGCYDSAPYVLLNYSGTVSSAFTLAHELGHSMHTQLSKINQPYQYANYKIFVAEVASTVNECLLFEYLMKKARAEHDTKMQAFLLNQKCDDFKATVFRQVMFAEFEKLIHERVEAGDALTPDALQDMYYDLNKQYFGPDVVADRRIALEWARIPHFYYNFYVYKYATSLCVAEKVVLDIVSGKEGAVERYLRFLSAGCTMDPLDLLKTHLGVDLTKTDCVREAIANFSKTVDELSTLL